MTFLDLLAAGINRLLAQRFVPVRWTWAGFLNLMLATYLLGGLLHWVMALLAKARISFGWLVPR